MAKVDWDGGTPPICKPKNHKKIVINRSLRIDNAGHRVKVYRCSVCGATGQEPIK